MPGTLVAMNPSKVMGKWMHGMVNESSTEVLEQEAYNASSQAARNLYEDLYPQNADEGVLASARSFLEDSLEQVADLPCDLPEHENGLQEWMQTRHEAVGRQFLEYLQERQDGGGRRYFSNRSHALYFLRGVSPTKLVDGSWLYGMLNQWWDDRYRGLIRIYLEELGEGLASENHVAMYRKLLAVNGCEHVSGLPDACYVQGVIQLSLARHAAHFVPEVVGFNLGYEQLPLHLLITAYELKELGIDPYYFQVHVTVDNACTGHARKAIEAVRLLKPSLADSTEYFQRVRRGYMLNDLGASTLSVIDSFDLHDELVRVLSEKSVHGRHMHSDACKIAGRTVNSWLSKRDDIPTFVHELEKQGWIKRHTDPGESRFWRLLAEGADMFGVFSAYERQVIHDWIAGDALDEQSKSVSALKSSSHTDKNLLRRVSPALSGTYDHLGGSDATGDFGVEMREFEERLLRAPNRRALMDRLVPLLDPSVHHTQIGLRATRMFSRLLDEAA